MTDAKTLKNKLQEELVRVRAIREELDLESTLARAEARSSWCQLEERLKLAQEEIDRIGGPASRPFHAIEEDSRALIDEVRHGYERLRHHH
jgi:predicted  nucleic acid-binding Zn-ribbon protein